MLVGRKAGLIRQALALCLGLLAWSGHANAAEPDWKLLQLRTDLTDLSVALASDTAMRQVPVATLVQDLDWIRPDSHDRFAPPLPSTMGPAVIGWTDARIALAKLAQVYGGKDNFDVLAAQRPGSTEAVNIVSGTATLTDLRHRLTPRHFGRNLETGAWVLRVPLVIAEGATLRLTRDDVLLLSRGDGAFIVNLGQLQVTGGEISATSVVNPRNDEFAPFVASLGSGAVHLSGATLKHLGFGRTEKFAGLSLLAYPTMYPSQRSVIENTRFEDVVTLAVVGVSNIEIRENRLFDMRRLPLFMSRAQNAVVAGNLFAGASPTNTIRIADGSDRARIIGNVLLEGSRAGMLVSAGSDHVVIRDNLIWHRNGGGVKIHEISCGIIERNFIIDDEQKGIEIRASRDTWVRDNTIIGNRNAGLWVSGQHDGEITYITGNQMRENGSGIATATAAGLMLQGNDLSRQLPLLLDGDVTPHFRAIVSDLRGETPILLDAGGAQPAERLYPADCS